MARKRKMTMSDLYNLRVDWHASQRCKNPATGNKATRFILSKSLTDEQKKTILAFKNTVVFDNVASDQYAPEITYSTVLLYDKCIR
jgi:hypothetical protein